MGVHRKPLWYESPWFTIPLTGVAIAGVSAGVAFAVLPPGHGIGSTIDPRRPTVSTPAAPQDAPSPPTPGELELPTIAPAEGTWEPSDGPVLPPPPPDDHQGS